MKKPQTGEDWMRMWNWGADINALLQLYITTKDQKYADSFLEKIWSTIEPPKMNSRGFDSSFLIGRGVKTAIIAIPYMNADYKEKLKGYVIKYKDGIKELQKKTTN